MNTLQFTAALLLGLIASLTFAAEPATPTTSTSAPPQSVAFDNQTLDLVWQGGTPDAPIYEYIPADETLEHWTHLASIREYHSIDDIAKLAAGTVQEVKQNYPGAPTQVVENPTNGDTIVDFLVGPPDGSFVEYNIFQYKKRAAGGIVAYQYALRAYGDTAEFLKDLDNTRGRLLNEMADNGLQQQ